MMCCIIWPKITELYISNLQTLLIYLVAFLQTLVAVPHLIWPSNSHYIYRLYKLREEVKSTHHPELKISANLHKTTVPNNQSVLSIISNNQ